MATATRPLELILKNLGFTDKEAKVYLALLQLGPTDAKQISQKSGIKKPTTYVILDDLRQKDAILFLPSAKKKLFAVKSPEELFEVAHSKLKQATANLPLLNSLAKESKDKAMVTYYEGRNNFIKAMKYKEDEVARNGELLCYFASAEKVDLKMFPVIDANLTRLKKQGVHLRGFASDNPTLAEYRKRDKDFDRDVKILPKELYSAYSSIEISETFVRFALFEQEMFVIIDNPDIARIMRQIFEMNWAKY